MDADLFIARVSDTVKICSRTCAPRFLGFLSESEAANADAILKKQSDRFCFFGGYSGAQRTMLACVPDWCEEPDFPITSFTAVFRKCDSLSHRDFLGALMALGITRESVGDILIEPGRAVFFVTDEIAPFVSSQLSKVGNTGINISSGFCEPLPGLGKKVLCSDTVASARLDCVVSALAGFSRRLACSAIEEGKVSVNSLVCEKVARTVVSGDRVTVRGKGRFEIESADTFSKKGRIILKYSKYV